MSVQIDYRVPAAVSSGQVAKIPLPEGTTGDDFSVIGPVVEYDAARLADSAFSLALKPTELWVTNAGVTWQTNRVLRVILQDRIGPAGQIGGSQSGEWQTIPSVFRLRLTGTGTCVMDSRNALGEIETAVESYVATAATNQIEFPYAGDDAVAVRFTLTGTCTAEVL